jgi:23S rRNA (adenine2503-C2)-methyltransferase
MKKVDLKVLSHDALEDYFKDHGLPAYRARQALHWIYERYASSIEDISEFSLELRKELGEVAYISNLAVLGRAVSDDFTEKFLFGLEDGETLESVLIPDKERLTLCVSSQAGCTMGCSFCRTGADGFRRNLMAHEIVDQVIQVNRNISPRRITNIVLMGMGEPLKNLDEVVEALKRLNGPLNISKRRITVSTSGIVPAMEELARRAPEVNLAVSLNATTDEVRDRIMPVNRKYPLKALMKACRRYPLQKRRRITFEYVMLGGLNDTDEDAWRLVGLVRGIVCKINLIPFNEYEGSGFRRPSDDRVLSFQSILVEAGLTAMIRKSKGSDIMAACGQLRHRKAAGTSLG